jgi:hypothetical protein
MAEADQLALDGPVAPAGFPRAIRSTNARSAGAVGLAVGAGRSSGGQRAWRARSRVRGDTSRSRRSGVGSSLPSALSMARSGLVSVGRVLVRRSMATSSRSVRISAFWRRRSGRAAPAAQHTNEHQVDESECQNWRSCWLSSGR